MHTPASHRAKPRTRRMREPGERSRRPRLAYAKPPSRAGTAARTFSGALAVGSLLLGLTLIVVQFWVTNQGQEGPGATAVVAQLVAGVVAVALQSVADRRRDASGGVATLAVFAVVFGSVWYWWLA